MPKITLTDPANKHNLVGPITENNAKIEAAIEKTLSRDGTSPNEMNVDLDMNGHRIINLPEPSNPDDPVRLQDLEGVASTYTLPVASGSVLGGVKDGTGVEIANDGTISTTSDFGQRSLFGFYAEVKTISATSYTLVPSDSGKVLRFTASTDINLIMPNSLPIGWNALISQKGVGKVIFSPASGAVVDNYHLYNSTLGQHSAGTMVVDANSNGTSAQYTWYGEGATSTGEFVPANVTPPSISGTYVVGSTLTTTNGSWTEFPTSYGYQWRRDGANIVGATSVSYTLVDADAGKVISVAVAAINGVGTSTPVISGSTPQITVGVPTNTVAPAVTGTPIESFTLTCSSGTWTGVPTSYTYQWYRNGSAISGATNNTYLLVLDDVTGTIHCVVTANNATGSTPATSNAIFPIAANGVPVNSVLPVISGTAQVSATLTTTNGTWSNSPSSYDYQWKVNGTNVGSNQNTYVVQSGDLGGVVTSTVTATNVVGAGSPATSTATSAVISSAWSPSTLTALKLWYDASDLTTITKDGSNIVSAWNDKSGNARHLAASSGQRPTWVASSSDIPGKNSIQFVRANGHKFSRTGDDNSTILGSHTGIAFMQNNYPWQYYAPVGLSGASLISDSSGGFGTAGVHCAFWDSAITETVYTNCFSTNGTVRTNANGTYFTPPDSGMIFVVAKSLSNNYARTLELDSSKIIVGNAGDSAGAWDGSISEIVLVRGAWTTSDRQKMEGYLAHKWGFASSLPSDHPYKASPP